MSSPQAGSDTIHHDDGGSVPGTPIPATSTRGGDALHTSSEATESGASASQSTRLENFDSQGNNNSNASSATFDARHASTSAANENDESRAATGSLWPHDGLASQTTDGGANTVWGISDYGNNENFNVTAASLSPASIAQGHPTAVHAGPATVLVQSIPNPTVDWPRVQEQYRAAHPLLLDENEQQNEAGLRLPPPNTNQAQPAVVERPGETVQRRTPVGSPGTLSRGGVTGRQDIAYSRWQPDADATYCPICRTQFSFFIRKHHCRKCGRVVCATCSPHRIIIPHQYIVRPPGSDFSLPSSFLVNGLGSSNLESNSLSGGERVRLCNPCVPDPNTAPPPQSPSPSIGPSSPSSRHRSRSSLAGSRGVAHPSNRYGTVFSGSDDADALRHYTRARSITLNPTTQASSSASSSRYHPVTPDPEEPLFYDLIHHFQQAGIRRSSRNRHNSHGVEAAFSSSRQRALSPPLPIPEEDECPVCHRELPLRSLANFESLREAHINSCIQAHSTYGSPRRAQAEEEAPAAPRRSGMYVYSATEKDCVDDAECTICLEEFTIGVPMARLECLCRFHKSCISAWFVNHPGRCPVHQHDGFGY